MDSNAFLKSLSEICSPPKTYSISTKETNKVELVYGRGANQQDIPTIEFLEPEGRGENKRREIFLGHLTDRLNNPEHVGKPEEHPWFRVTEETQTQSTLQIHIGRQDTAGNYHPYVVFTCKDTDLFKYKDAVEGAAGDLGHTLAGIAARRRFSSRPGARPDELNG